jgi:hypothetical protein
MKHTKAMVVNFRKDWEGNDEYCLFPFAMSSYTEVCKVQVEFEVPDDFNPVAAQIKVLQAQKDELNRQFLEKLQEIKEQISKLEALEYSEAA